MIATVLNSFVATFVDARYLVGAFPLDLVQVRSKAGPKKTLKNQWWSKWSKRSGWF